MPSCTYSGKKGKVTVEMVPVHQQDGGEDCGAIAIAFAVELAFGGDSRTIMYEQESMRNHLEYCISHGHLFPVADVAELQCRSL